MTKPSFPLVVFLAAVCAMITACTPKPYAGTSCIQPGAKTGLELDPAYFGIYTSTVDGQNLRRIFSDPCREINHARVSPDGQWVTFTRYNHKDPATGLAMETTGYGNTEIMVGRIDGSQLRSVVEPKPGAISGNGYWTPDGTGILFVSLKHGQLPTIKQIDFTSEKIDVAPGNIITVKTMTDRVNTDPHQVGDRLVFASRANVDDPNAIWMIDDDTASARQVSFPKVTQKTAKLADAHPGVGDFDPKLSPDGQSVVFMRRAGKDSWHVIRVDLASGQAANLSQHEATDATPEWSPDGSKLIFWHVDLKNLKKSGLYIMDSDGSNRRRIPLPGGYFYTMPSYMPVNQSNPDGTMIIFSAKKEPLL